MVVPAAQLCGIYPKPEERLAVASQKTGKMATNFGREMKKSMDRIMEMMDQMLKKYIKPRESNLQENGMTLEVELPDFNGRNPKWWIYQAEHHFQMNLLEESKKFGAAMVRFEGEAMEWFHWADSQRPIHDWKELKVLMVDRFCREENQGRFAVLEKIEQIEERAQEEDANEVSIVEEFPASKQGEVEKCQLQVSPSSLEEKEKCEGRIPKLPSQLKEGIGDGQEQTENAIDALRIRAEVGSLQIKQMAQSITHEDELEKKIEPVEGVDDVSVAKSKQDGKRGWREAEI